MSNAAPPGHPTPAPPREIQPLPGLLSLLVPGLGQIYQGRIGKGVLFLLCIYALFFYGMWLGSGSVRAGEPERTYTVSGNVYLPASPPQNAPIQGMPQLAADLYNRPQYIGQFWVGLAAWPALWQWATYDKDYDPNDPRFNPADPKYDAHFTKAHPAPLLGQFERTPTDEALNAVHTYGDKVMDLGWVYTVIAGVLNILVIYDALAGPAFLPRKPDPAQKAMA